MLEITGQGTITGADNVTRTVSTLAAQRLGQEGTALALQQAQQMSQQTGNVYTLNDAGQVVELRVGGQPVRTESAMARLSQDQLRESELTGKVRGADGVMIDTLAARQLSQQQADALRDQALRQSQLTGVMHSVNAQGQVVPEQGADGKPISTEAARAQRAQESQQQRALAVQRADSLSQQTGLAYKINDAGDVVPDTDAQGQQRTTVQAQQLAQQRELQLAELRGTVEIEGPNGTRISVPTVAAQQMQQGAFRNALAQAEMQSQQSGLAFTVDATGKVIPQTDAQGRQLTTIQAQQLAQQREMQMAELTGNIMVNGVNVSTLAAKQLTQQQARDLAQQAAQRSELTGFMYKVGDNGQIVQEFGPDNKPITTAQAQQDAARLGQQESQFGRSLAESKLERELRELLGTQNQQLGEKQLLIDLAKALSGTGSAPQGLIDQLTKMFGLTSYQGTTPGTTPGTQSTVPMQGPPNWTGTQGETVPDGKGGSYTYIFGQWRYTPPTTPAGPTGTPPWEQPGGTPMTPPEPIPTVPTEPPPTGTPRRTTGLGT